MGKKEEFFSVIIFKNIFYLYLQKDFMRFKFSTYMEKGNEKWGNPKAGTLSEKENWIIKLLLERYACYYDIMF